MDEQAAAAAAVTEAGLATDDELNQQISDVLTELITHAQDMGQGIATEFGLAGSDATALLRSRNRGWPAGSLPCRTGGARTSCSPRRA